jgi:L-lactate dehydrogenase complex protein LldE
MSEPTRSQPPRQVSLMATCLADAFFDDVAVATVLVLEHLGCQVSFPEAQTCCAQPAFNAGDWLAARPVARHTLSVFRDAAEVVAPSGSCARMLSHGSLLLFEGEPDLAAAEELATRSWELSDFIVNGLGVRKWPGRLSQRVLFHASCHSRGTRYATAARTLLASIAGLELVEFREAEQCCGFGGTFSVNFPGVSHEMGALKLSHASEANANVLVSADMGCLMHLDGLGKRQGAPLRTRHLAQVLRDALEGVEATA